MHYYLEHGRNRDLEKYLRLQRMSNATRSSSDGSLPGLDELQRKVAGCPNRSGLGKSMENLSTLRKKAEQQELLEGEKSLRNASAESALSANKSAEQSDNKVGSTTDVKGVSVKEKKCEQKSGKNFNFNLESVIEINLPPPQSIAMATPAVAAAIAPITYTQPAALPPQVPSFTTEPARTIVHENSTQTAVSEDDPIRPVVKTHAHGTGEETFDSLKDISPVSSIASNKQKLEWDSLGDIGYDSSERLQLCGAADLNETEKRCLQRYFARKGLNFDRSVVVVRQREEREKKFRTEDGSIMLVNPGAQSTPKPTAVMPTKREEMKSTQTSLRARGMESRGIQASVCNTASIEPSDAVPLREDKAVGTAESYTLASVDAAESFEFYSPSVPETENNTPSVAGSGATPVHSSSTTSSSAAGNDNTAPEPNNCSQRPTFDDEVKLGLTLYNSICELKSMPTGVKESLIDKIFRKLSRHDPKKRTREQLLQDYAESIRKRNVRGDTVPKPENVYDDVGSSGEKMEDKSVESGQQEKGLVTKEGIVQEIRVSPESISGSVNVSIGSVKGSSSGSNKATNERHDPAERYHGSIEASSHQTGSSLVVSIGTTKENAPRKLSAPEARDRRVRKAMQDYLKPMTHSEVEYENLRDLKRLNKQRSNEPKLAQIDRAIEQLLMEKMLLLNAGGSVPVQATEQLETVTVASQLPSDVGGTSAYTSVHENGSGNSIAKDSSSGWNSHYNMAKVINNRSKLETPTVDTSSPASDVSIPTFIKQKKEKFVENYDQGRQRRAFDEQNHIYTRPYSSSGQRNGDKRRQQEKENFKFGKDKYVMNKLSKGLATDRQAPSSSSNSPISPQFISSDSISIPVVTTLTNTTTTHQYDIKSRRPSPPLVTGRTAGTQTTDSILRTKPIFGASKSKVVAASASAQVPSIIDTRNQNLPHSLSECHCPCGHLKQQLACENRTVIDDNRTARRRTEIIDATGSGRQDKQAQTKPTSIAYVITFDTGDKERKTSPVIPTPSPSPRSSSGSSIYESEPENRKDDHTEKILTLREQFRRSCPTTLSKIEQRRQCINELNKLRSKRNQQRQRLLLLTSDDSLRKTNSVGRGKLPPPPLSQRRVFASTRVIRESTRQRVRNLPEVLRKKEIERFNNLKRKNLIMKDVYNKNLQRKVLRGQVDLSNSVRVIQD